MSERVAVVRTYGNGSEVYARSRKHQQVHSCSVCKFYCAAEWSPLVWPGPGATAEQIEAYQRAAHGVRRSVESAEAAHRAHSCEANQ